MHGVRLVSTPARKSSAPQVSQGAPTLTVGAPRDPETQIVSLIAQAPRDRVHGFVETGLETEVVKRAPARKPVRARRATTIR